jgi:hypothetical protein
VEDQLFVGVDLLGQDRQRFAGEAFRSYVNVQLIESYA